MICYFIWNKNQDEMETSLFSIEDVWLYIFTEKYKKMTHSQPEKHDEFMNILGKNKKFTEHEALAAARTVWMCGDNYEIYPMEESDDSCKSNLIDTPYITCDSDVMNILTVFNNLNGYQGVFGLTSLETLNNFFPSICC